MYLYILYFYSFPNGMSRCGLKDKQFDSTATSKSLMEIKPVAVGIVERPFIKESEAFGPDDETTAAADWSD